MPRYQRKKRKQRLYILATLTGGLFLAVIIILVGMSNKEPMMVDTTLEPSISAVAPSVKSYILAEQTTPSPSEEPEPRYGFTEDDIYLLAQLLCGGKDRDGDGEYDIDFEKEVNYYEVSKVLGVVMNRVRSDDFPDTVYDVVMQKGQFSVIPRNCSREPSDIALQTVKDWCEAYDRHDMGVQAIPEDHLYFTGDGITNTTRAQYK